MDQMTSDSEREVSPGKTTFFHLFEAKISHGTEEKLNYHHILKERVF